MTRRVSVASVDQFEWLALHDRSVSQDWVRRCIMLQEYLVLEDDRQEIGFIRWSRFWGEIPYMDMILIEPSFRNCGAGKLLYQHWEDEMVRLGVNLLMTSCERDEPAPLRWHRKNGFEIVGEVEFPGLQESKEVFLAKRLV
ncbi:MAG: GNAT family N-acetyltransferase [Pseudomonadota bacterium]